MLRGDDVSDLQARLARLGFDCGKVDGIFGPLTAGAFQQFQRNCGLAADGVCGADSVRLLTRLARQTGDGPGIAMLREGERFRNTRLSLGCSRVVVGQFGGLSTLARLIGKQLRSAGALVVPLDEPDALTQATIATVATVDCVVLVSVPVGCSPDPRGRTLGATPATVVTPCPRLATMGLNPIGNPNWAKQTADTVEQLVGTVRDRTTTPIVCSRGDRVRTPRQLRRRHRALL